MGSKKGGLQRKKIISHDSRNISWKWKLLQFMLNQNIKINEMVIGKH
jgi:hypothetical protein